MEYLDKLLSDVKAYNNITWDDENENAMLKSYILSSISYLEGVYGHPLNFSYIYDETYQGNEEFININIYVKDIKLAYELIMNRVFYLKNKALDDFNKNYSQLLMQLYRNGKVQSELIRRGTNATQQ